MPGCREVRGEVLNLTSCVRVGNMHQASVIADWDIQLWKNQQEIDKVCDRLQDLQLDQVRWCAVAQHVSACALALACSLARTRLWCDGAPPIGAIVCLSQTQVVDRELDVAEQKQDRFEKELEMMEQKVGEESGPLQRTRV